MAKKKISSLSVVLGATVAPFTKAFSAAGNAVTSLTSKVTGAGAAILKVTGIAGGIGAVFAALKGAASGISIAAELEQVGVAFETMLGSAEAAKQLMGELTDFAAATPFEFPEIASSAKKLLAMGVASNKVTDTLKMLGDIGAGIGKPLGELSAIYGKIRSRGQLTGESLNQLAEAGVPIYKALAKELGVAESQVAGLVSKGQVGFPKVHAALAGLTAEGGQFAGMMDKQSRTLAGMWSTLTDNVGLAMAGLVNTIVDAFSLRDALSGFTDAVGRAGDIVNNLVAWIAPIVVGWVRSTWSTVQGIFGAISNALGGMRQMWFGMLMSIWNVVSAIGGQIAAAWSGLMQLLGVEATSAGSVVSSAFNGIVAVLRWFYSTSTLIFNVVAYAITHWRDTLNLALVSAAYGIVRFANQVVHFIGTVIPDFLAWFGRNWKQVFTDIYNATGLILVNLYDNLTGFFSAVWSWLKGDGFNWKWTGLLEGFESTLEELPQIAERQIGPLEQSLASQAAAMGKAYGDGLREHLAKQDQAAQKATEGLVSTLNHVLDKLSPPTTENVAAAIAQGVTEPAEEAAAAAAKAKDELEALFAGSAQAQLARAQAAFTARVSGSASPATPKAAPVDPAASRAAREAAQSNGFLKQMVELAKGQSKTLTRILEKDTGGLSPATF